MNILKFILEMPFSARQRRIALERKPITEEEFVSIAAKTEIGRRASIILWNKINEIKVVNELTPYPEDCILYIYGLSEEDLDEDIILYIIKEMKLNIPTSEVINKVGKIEKLIDIIYLIEQI